MRKALLLAAGVMLVQTACHKHKAARTTPPPPAADATTGAAARDAGETGVASWYGHPYHGRASASGEIYDMEQMTAAHRTLAFGTMVRVHDLDNEKTVDVRINDRGPFVDGRVIDLSHAAAQAIQMIGPGTAQVRLEILSSPAAAPAYFGVQVGAFRNRDNAERQRRAMEAQYGRARLIQRADTPGFWHVVVGLEPALSGAAALSNRILSENSSIKSALVVRIDNL